MLEGLEEISEEEQLELLLEISKQEAGPQSERTVETLPGLPQSLLVGGRGSVGRQAVTGTDGAELAVVESGELLPVHPDLLPVLQFPAPHSQLVGQKSLVDLEFLPAGEILVAGETLGAAAVKHVEDAGAAGYDHLVQLLRHTGALELGPVLYLVLVLQPGQQVSHGSPAQFTDEVSRLAIDHQLGKVDVGCFSLPGWLGASRYHSSGFSD